MTRCRGRRSAQTPPTSRKITKGAVRAARTAPRADAEPCVRSRIAKTSAIGATSSPTIELALARKTKRNSRSWSAPKRSRIATYAIFRTFAGWSAASILPTCFTADGSSE